MTELHENTIAHNQNAIAMALSPFLELLTDQKQNMTQTKWLSNVRILMFRIIETPEQYLPKDLSQSDATTGHDPVNLSQIYFGSNSIFNKHQNKIG